MNETTIDQSSPPTETLLQDAAVTKTELLQTYWEDPDMHMQVDFPEFCGNMREQIVRALSQGIVQKPE